MKIAKGVLESENLNKQHLDTLSVEIQRGITVKAKVFT